MRTRGIAILALATMNAFGLSLNIQPCPLVPYQGMVHVYGKVDSMTVVRNKVKHDSKEFKGLRESRNLWSTKIIARISADSIHGSSHSFEKFEIYPGEYSFKQYSDSSTTLDSLKSVFDGVAVFECEKHGIEIILKKTYSKQWLDSHKKRCAEKGR